MSTLAVVRKFFPKVTSVTDATRAAAIEVTIKDNSSAQVRNHNACAMAVACKRKFHLDGVIISRTIAYLVKGKKARRFQLPESVSREVVSFDRGSGFAPGKYSLQAVPPANKMGAIKNKRKDNRTDRGDRSTDNPRKFRHLTTGVRSVLGGMKPE